MLVPTVGSGPESSRCTGVSSRCNLRSSPHQKPGQKALIIHSFTVRSLSSASGDWGRNSVWKVLNLLLTARGVHELLPSCSSGAKTLSGYFSADLTSIASNDERIRSWIPPNKEP